MSSAKDHNASGNTAQPSLAELLARYLQRQADAQASGIAAPDPVGEVVPYEVGPVQPIDAKPAWDAAIGTMQFYSTVDGKSLSAPPQWPQLVAAHEPEVALPFSLGNFPQLVRSFQTLAQCKNLAELRPQSGRPVQSPALVEWAEKVSGSSEYPRILLALATLRLAKHFDAADLLVTGHDAQVPAQWRDAWDNEKAALAWQRGRHEEALAAWQAMKPTVPVLFNRGMAAIFCGKGNNARDALTQAVKMLPESSPWHHLGQLYLTLGA